MSLFGNSTLKRNPANRHPVGGDTVRHDSRRRRFFNPVGSENAESAAPGFSRWRSAFVMATCGAIAASLAVAGLANFEAEALLILVPAATFSAFVSGLLVFPRFAHRTSFDWPAAAVGGAVTALLAFPVFALIVLGVVAWDFGEDLYLSPPDAKAWFEIIMFAMFGLPALFSPLVCPIGALAGLLLRWLHLREARAAAAAERRGE